MKFRFLLLFLIFGLIFVGCSKEDCSLKDTTYQKYSLDEDTGECIALKPIEQNVCGNKVIEKGENACNCPNDVQLSHPTLGCSGALGIYIEKSCNDNKECIFMQNKKVVEQIKKVEFKLSDLSLDADFKLNMPYVQNTADENNVEVSIKLIKTSSNSLVIRDIVVKELVIEDSNAIVLAKAEYNEAVDSVNNELSKKILKFSDVTKYEKKEPLKLKLVLSYSKDYLNTNQEISRTENKIETITSSLGTWTIINPNLYEEEKKK